MHSATAFLRRQFDILKAVAAATYKEWSAYRSHSMVSLFVGPVYFLVQYFIWKAVYTYHDVISGLTLDQMITYFAVSTLISYATMDFADWNLQMLIRTGKFLTFMLRPVSHVYFAFSQKVGHRALGMILELLPLYLIFALVFGIRFSPPQPGWAVLSVALGFIILFLVNYCIGVTAFWITRTSGVRRMFLLMRDICSGALVPLTLFPLFFQRLFFVLPFQFITYVPIRVFIGSYELAGVSCTIPGIVGVQAAAAAVMALFTAFFYRLGVKRFTAVGV